MEEKKQHVGTAKQNETAVRIYVLLKYFKYT